MPEGTTAISWVVQGRAGPTGPADRQDRRARWPVRAAWTGAGRSTPTPTPTPTGAYPDNNLNTAVNVSTLNCGYSATETGANENGTSAWYVVTFNNGGGTSSLRVQTDGSDGNQVTTAETSAAGPNLAGGVHLQHHRQRHLRTSRWPWRAPAVGSSP